MGVEENKAAVHRFIEEFLNQRNVAVVDELFSPDFVDHQGALDATGDRESVKQFVQFIRGGFPGLRCRIERLVAEDDYVVAFVSGHATHTGEFRGVPASGRTVTILGISIMRFQDGKIAERWNVTDFAALMQQIT